MLCPICGKPTHDDYKPFCSDRCKTVDLGRWLNGNYAVPVVEDDDLPDDMDDIESGEDHLRH
jgi:uncharacterized protein